MEHNVCAASAPSFHTVHLTMPEEMLFLGAGHSSSSAPAQNLEGNSSLECSWHHKMLLLLSEQPVEEVAGECTETIR